MGKSVDGLVWELTAVYASLNPTIRRCLMEKLGGIEVSQPWILVGDFNCILHGEETSSNTEGSCSFKNLVGEIGLLNISFIENRFTWSHGIILETRRAAKLDRALCRDEWRRMFPSAIV